jgi:hypothetical protein
VVESFNGKLRDELLNREWFRTRAEARVLIERWLSSTTSNGRTPRIAINHWRRCAKSGANRLTSFSDSRPSGYKKPPQVSLASS